MRIAFAHYSTEDDIGGASSWLIRLASDLRQQGWKVAVLLPHQGDHPAKSTIVSALRTADVEVFLQPQARYAKDSVLQTLDFLNTWRPTVFLPQCLATHFIAAVIAGRQGLPWALTVHSDDPQYWSILRLIRPAGSGGCTVCVSHYLAREVKRRGFDSDPLVIPCGVPLPAHQVHHNPNSFHVVYSGRLIEVQKRISLVVASLIRACQASPRIRATIIGAGKELQNCQQQVHNAGLVEAIHFTGRLPPNKVLQLLDDSQAILLMSDFEGLPVALMEAMAAGVVPVARSIASGIPELVRHQQTGLLVSDDPTEAAAAILRLAQDPKLWQQCSSASRDLVHRAYGQPQTLQQWNNLIKDLQTRSTPQYPIKKPPIAITIKLKAACIDFLWWTLPEVKRKLSLEFRFWMAQFKHRIKRTIG
jgi:colanic acid/amylovoran biosynthesis glycosyltransferase